MPRNAVTPGWRDDDFFKEINRRDLMFDPSSTEPSLPFASFIDLIELYGNSNYSIRFNEIVNLRATWIEDQKKKKKSCKEKCHERMLLLELGNWNEFAGNQQRFDKTKAKGTSGYVENVYSMYLIRKMFWESATGLRYTPGPRPLVFGCPNKKCGDHRPSLSGISDKDYEGQKVKVNPFQYFIPSTFGQKEGEPRKPFGLKKLPKIPEAFYTQYPAFRMAKGRHYNFFHSEHFANKVTYFGMQYNFIPSIDQSSSSTEADPSENKLVGVAMGIVTNDPGPYRLVISRFKETKSKKTDDAVPKYYTVQFTATGRYIDLGKNSMLRHKNKEDRNSDGKYFQERNAHMTAGVTFFHSCDFDQGVTKRDASTIRSERQWIWNELTQRGWKSGLLFALPIFEGEEPYRDTPPKKLSSVSKKNLKELQLQESARKLPPPEEFGNDTNQQTPSKLPRTTQKKPQKSKVSFEEQVPNDEDEEDLPNEEEELLNLQEEERLRLEEEEELLDEEEELLDSEEEVELHDKETGPQDIEEETNGTGSRIYSGTGTTQGTHEEVASNNKEVQEYDSDEEYLNSYISKYSTDFKGLVKIPRVTVPAWRLNKLVQDIAAERKRFSQIVRKQEQNFQSYVQELSSLRQQICNNDENNGHEPVGLIERPQTPVKPIFPEPEHLILRDGDEFTKGMYDGLDSIAEIQMYNWLGTMKKGIRTMMLRLGSTTMDRLKQESEIRAQAITRYKEQVIEYEDKIKEYKGKQRAIEKLEPYNPDTPLKLGQYRSNIVLHEAIHHWHKNKQQLIPKEESEKYLNMITMDLEPALGMTDSRRGYSQVPIGEYAKIISEHCVNWWVSQEVDQEDLDEGDMELEAFDDRFDMGPEAEPTLPKVTQPDQLVPSQSEPATTQPKAPISTQPPTQGPGPSLFGRSSIFGQSSVFGLGTTSILSKPGTNLFNSDQQTLTPRDKFLENSGRVVLGPSTGSSTTLTPQKRTQAIINADEESDDSSLLYLMNPKKRKAKSTSGERS